MAFRIRDSLKPKALGLNSPGPKVKSLMADIPTIYLGPIMLTDISLSTGSMAHRLVVGDQPKSSCSRNIDMGDTFSVAYSGCVREMSSFSGVSVVLYHQWACLACIHVSALLTVYTKPQWDKVLMLLAPHSDQNHSHTPGSSFVFLNYSVACQHPEATQNEEASRFKRTRALFFMTSLLIREGQRRGESAFFVVSQFCRVVKTL